MSRPRATSVRSVINLPVREKPDARRNEPKQSACDRDILWKTLGLSSQRFSPASRASEIRVNTGISATPPSTDTQSMTATQQRRRLYPQKNWKCRRKEKTRPGGQPDGSKPYGRLGWMGARAEYSRWGGITAPTPN